MNGAPRSRAFHKRTDGQYRSYEYNNWKVLERTSNSTDGRPIFVIELADEEIFMLKVLLGADFAKNLFCLRKIQVSKSSWAKRDLQKWRIETEEKRRVWKK
jgi:hypothetical protein